MSNFAYTARTRAGEKIEGSIQAADKRVALLQLEKKGYVPVSVKEQDTIAPPKPPGGNLKSPLTERESESTRTPKGRRKAASTTSEDKPTLFAWQRRMSLRDLLFFTREMSDLLASGMTLGEALHTLSNRKTNAVQDRIIATLRDDIIQGASLSEALSHHPESFGTLHTSMVQAGEASGTLPEVLERLCKHYERVQDAQEKVLTAMVYPAVIILVGLGTVIFSMIYVIPRFTAIFEDLESELPASTQLLKTLSDGLINYWWLLLILIVTLAIMGRRAVATPVGRRVWDGFKLRVPVVKNIVKANAFGHFARTLGTLLNNGVPVLGALSIVENTVGNEIIREEIADARERVTDGATISSPLAEGRVFPRLLTDMLAVGEKSGNMSGALMHIANRYDRELDRTVKIFTTVLEPLMILIMAALVGFVAISMLSAVFGMTSGLSP